TLLAAEQTSTSEMWYQGTADAVRQSLSHISGHPHSHVIILSGDQLYSMDYRLMLDHHERYGEEITIAATPVRAEEAPGFGILKTDANRRISEFYEQPALDQLGGKESRVSRPMEAARRIYLAAMSSNINKSPVLRAVLDANRALDNLGKQT